MAIVRVSKTIVTDITAALEQTFLPRLNVLGEEHKIAAELTAHEAIDASTAVFAECAEMPPAYTHAVKKIAFRIRPRGASTPILFRYVDRPALVPAGLLSTYTHKYSHNGSEYAMGIESYESQVLRLAIVTPAPGSHAERFLDAEDALRKLNAEIASAKAEVGQLLESAGTVNAALKQFPPLEALLAPHIIDKLGQKQARVKPQAKALDEGLATSLGAQIAVAKMRGAL